MRARGQREMAAEIARGISARLSPAQSRVLAESRPVNPRAYAEYPDPQTARQFQLPFADVVRPTVMMRGGPAGEAEAQPLAPAIVHPAPTTMT